MDQLAATLDNLVGSMYEAAFAEERWTEVIQRCAVVMNGAAGSFYCLDFVDRSTSLEPSAELLSATFGVDGSALQAYAEHYTYTNVWQKAEDHLPEGRAVTSSMLFPDDKLERTEFYNDWLRPQGFFYALGGAVVRQGTRAVKASILRPRSFGAFDADEVRQWQTLIPHLRRALELRRRLRLVEFSQAAAFAALEALAQGVILVSPAGQVVFRNGLAASLTRQRGVVIDAAGTLRGTDWSRDQRLQRMVRDAIDTGSGVALPAGAGALSSSGPAGSVHLFVAPLPVHSDVVPLNRCAAVVFLTDPHAKPPDLSAVLSELYQMTPAEARLTSALASGVTLGAYAQERGLTLNTVRTQLKAAASKAGAKRQADLVRIVLTGPAVLRAQPHDGAG